MVDNFVQIRKIPADRYIFRKKTNEKGKYPRKTENE